MVEGDWQIAKPLKSSFLYEPLFHLLQRTVFPPAKYFLTDWGFKSYLDSNWANRSSLSWQTVDRLSGELFRLIASGISFGVAVIGASWLKRTWSCFERSEVDSHQIWYNHHLLFRSQSVKRPCSILLQLLHFVEFCCRERSVKWCHLLVCDILFETIIFVNNSYRDSSTFSSCVLLHCVFLSKEPRMAIYV